MIAAKKISEKKLAIYVLTMALMISGTAFMLYQNKRLTSPRAPVINPAEFGGSTPTADIASPQAETGETASGLQAGPAKAPAISKVKPGTGIDLTIFSSDKFKNLKEEQPPIKPQAELGKRDPFSPN
ncbi:MAG: hypothetical protein Q8O93_04970 [bacterium]|nr:hypothetical protein [bacterium]